MLTQNVDTSNAAFPVVADPSYVLGYYIVPVVYITWSRAETVNAYKYIDHLTLLGNLICTGFPGAGKAFCVTVTNYYYADLKAALVSATPWNRCLKARLPLTPGIWQFVVGDFYSVLC